MASLLLQRREVPEVLVEQLAPGGVWLFRLVTAKSKGLVLIERGKEGAERRVLDAFGSYAGKTVR